MITLIRIRLLQLKRIISDEGIVTLFMAAILLVLIYAAYIGYQKKTDTLYILAFLALGCLSIQLKRNDLFFIYTNLKRPHLQIYLEYVMLVSPFVTPILFTPHWYYFFGLMLVIYFLPFLKLAPKQKTYFKNISSFIPPANFEMISGFRKSFISITFLYISALCLSGFSIYPYIPLWLITITTTSFYFECEPLQILKKDELPVERFLQKKMYQHGICLLIFYLPILVINTFFNPGEWLLNILFLSVQVGMLCFTICLKYTTYLPNQNYSANSVTLGLFSLGSILPHFLPVSLFMSFDYYNRAKKNLKNYLYD